MMPLKVKKTGRTSFKKRMIVLFMNKLINHPLSVYVSARPMNPMAAGRIVKIEGEVYYQVLVLIISVSVN